jgi:hypothetical protein
MQIDIWTYYKEKPKLYIEDFINYSIWNMEE